MHYNTIFYQLQTFFSRHDFENIVKSFKGDKYTKNFSCWQQFITMLYAQATEKDSIRDIIICLNVHKNKWYHIGLKKLTRSNLSHANSKRPYQIYEKLFYTFLEKCKTVIPKHKFKFKNPLYALDSTTVDLCLSIFEWAKFRQRKGGLKIHTLLELGGNIPSFIVITEAKKHDVKAVKEIELPLSLDSIIVMDKAYIDFKWLKTLDNSGIFWISRAKSNMNYCLIGQLNSNTKRGIISDKIIKLTGAQSSKNYPDKIRLIEYYDKDTDKHYQFITNNFKLSAYTISQIYKARWQIEIFFKWIKQNLKIKTFLGTTRNAVLTQIWIAMIYYLLLIYIKYQTKYSCSLLDLSRIIRETLFMQINLIDLLSIKKEQINSLKNYGQLELPLIY